MAGVTLKVVPFTSAVQRPIVRSISNGRMAFDVYVCRCPRQDSNLRHTV